MCTSTDPNVMQDCIRKLSSVLQWKPDDIEAMTRRGILSYRLRQLSQAKSDLDFAVRKSQAQSVIGLPNLDSLRYRCLVLSEIRDTDGALNDIDEIMKQTPDCPLTLSLRATIRAGKGDFEGARDDLSVVKAALEQGGGSQTSLADENRDLDLIAKAWTHSSVSCTRQSRAHLADLAK
jgi:regulator of sirC expression with transglutaminase-like and TPR domain